MQYSSFKNCFYFFFTIVFSLSTVNAQESPKLEGRWNLNIEYEGENLPAWLEVTHSGYKTLVGRFVYAFGSARPIAEIKVKNDIFNFNIPPQWGKGDINMAFEGSWDTDKLKGIIMLYSNGKNTIGPLPEHQN